MLKPGLIRFILASMVILYHISKHMPLGGFAVACFYIMSGYWISLMYQNKYLKTDNLLKVFYVSRVWRLWPAFYFFTLCAVLMNYVYQTKLWENMQHLSGNDSILFWISNLTLLTYNLSDYRLLGTAWSLDIEMQFYILFPLVFLFTRKNKNLQITAIGFFFILSVILEIYYSTSIMGKSVFVFLYLFLLGIFMYNFRLLFPVIVEKVGLSLFVILFLCQTAIPSLRAIGLDTHSGAYILFLGKLQILLVFPTLTNSVYNRSDKKDRVLGDMSYLIYISHWVWILPYNELIEGTSNKLMRIPYAAGFIVATFVSSYIIYKILDRPSEKLRHKWVGSHISTEKVENITT